MNYNDAIKSIGGRLRFGIKPGLDRIRRLLCRMGNPQDVPQVIHIAGTNGKGSTGAMIAESFVAAGVNVGHFSSPYLESPTEYFKINGEQISEDEFAALYQQVLAFSDSTETEFEIICAMAFKLFADKGCEVSIIECGLGGLEDATNVIAKPNVCVLTSISLDHTDFLGSTIEEIANNKCGIIKPGCCVVSAPEQKPEVFDVIKKVCKKISVKLIDCSGESSFDELDLSPKMPGSFQMQNARTAYEVLKCFGIDETFIKTGIEKATLPARCEVLRNEPLIILDGCHNPDAAKKLSDSLKDILKERKAAALFGMINTKDYSEVVRILAPNFSIAFACDGFRYNSVPSAELARCAKEYTEAVDLMNYEEAVIKALRYCDNNSMPLVIFGSLYLSGKLRPLIKKYLSES